MLGKLSTVQQLVLLVLSLHIFSWLTLTDRLAQQRKLSKDGRPAITAISSALLGSANQCLAFFALSAVAQSHLNQGQDSPFPAPSRNIAVARKHGI